MEDKMADGAFGCASNYGWDGPFRTSWANNFLNNELYQLKVDVGMLDTEKNALT